MGSSTFLVLLAVTTVVLAGLRAEAAAPGPSDTKVYIVFLDPSKGLKPQALLQSVFQSLSGSAVGSSKHATEALIYEYRTFSGFAAKLSIIEAQKLSQTPGVLSVNPDKKIKLDPPFNWD